MAKLNTLKPRFQWANTLTKAVTTQTERTTGRKLQEIRRRWLAANPLCVRCESMGIITAANEVDHITPLWEGGKDTDSNRQSLCYSCHKLKTKAEQARRSLQ